MTTIDHLTESVQSFLMQFELGALVSDILTLLAIAAAVSVPYIAAGIERQRRRHAAVRLAELVCEALETVATYYGGRISEDSERLREASDTLHLPSLLARMDALPTDSIDRTTALDAFIRISGAARAMMHASNSRQGALSVPEATDLLTEVPRLCDLANKQLAILRSSLGEAHA